MRGLPLAVTRAQHSPAAARCVPLQLLRTLAFDTAVPLVPQLLLNYAKALGCAQACASSAAGSQTVAAHSHARRCDERTAQLAWGVMLDSLADPDLWLDVRARCTSAYCALPYLPPTRPCPKSEPACVALACIVAAAQVLEVRAASEPRLARCVRVDVASAPPFQDTDCVLLRSEVVWERIEQRCCASFLSHRVRPPHPPTLPPAPSREGVMACCKRIFAALQAAAAEPA